MCPRCNGLCVVDSVCDVYGELVNHMIRCINCGNLFDEVSDKHKTDPPVYTNHMKRNFQSHRPLMG